MMTEHCEFDYLFRHVWLNRHDLTISQAGASWFTDHEKALHFGARDNAGGDRDKDLIISFQSVRHDWVCHAELGLDYWGKRESEEEQGTCSAIQCNVRAGS